MLDGDWSSDVCSSDLRLPAPSARADGRVRAWHAPFFALTDRPQKPTLALCHEQLLATWRPAWADPAGSPPPGYDACVRAYNRRGADEKLRGRHTGSARRSRTAYTERDYSGFAPWEEIHADGWHTHFLAPRELDRIWAALEVWHFHDCRTRFVTPLAIGYTENTDVILAGLQDVVRVGGVPARWQTDHTGSVKKAAVSGRRNAGTDAADEHETLESVADRLGITVLHPQTVGNSQANGIAENWNTWLDRECRGLATYMNPARQDERTFVRVRRLLDRIERLDPTDADQAGQIATLRAQVEREGKGYLFVSEADARAFLQGLVAKWNHKPHRSLPTVRDAATGRKRHQTPAEALDAARRGGWQMVAMTAAQLRDAFRDHLRKTVRRGVVTLHNRQRYFHAALAAFEGGDVLVVPHEEDPTQVWVKTLQGELIAVAAIAGAVPGRLQTTRDASEIKRANARIRRHEQAIDQIEAALQPVLEHLPGATALPGVIEVTARVLPEPAVKESLTTEAAAPLSMLDLALAEVKAREAGAKEREEREWEEAMAERAARKARWAEQEAAAQRQRDAENAALQEQMDRSRAAKAAAAAAEKAEREAAEAAWRADLERRRAPQPVSGPGSEPGNDPQQQPPVFDRAVGA
jgi:putative transposase